MVWIVRHVDKLEIALVIRLSGPAVAGYRVLDLHGRALDSGPRGIEHRTANGSRTQILPERGRHDEKQRGGKCENRQTSVQRLDRFQVPEARDGMMKVAAKRRIHGSSPEQ